MALVLGSSAWIIWNIRTNLHQVSHLMPINSRENFTAPVANNKTNLVPPKPTEVALVAESDVVPLSFVDSSYADEAGLTAIQIKALEKLCMKTLTEVNNQLSLGATVVTTDPNVRLVSVRIPKTISDYLASMFRQEALNIAGSNLEVNSKFMRTLEAKLQYFGRFPMTYSFEANSPDFAAAKEFSVIQAIDLGAKPSDRLILETKMETGAFRCVYGKIADKALFGG